MIAYSVALIIFQVVGVLASGAFLWLHRPTRWRHLPAIDAMGFPAIVLLVFVRSLALTIANFPAVPRGPGQVTFSVVTFLIIDALLVVKLLNFRAFVRRDQARVSTVDLQRPA